MGDDGLERMKRSQAHARVEIDSRSAKAVRRGHPWVWRNAIRQAPRSLAAGALTSVFDANGFVGHGLWDPTSPIAIRIYTRLQAESLGLGTLTSSVMRAVDARAPLFDPTDTNAYRMCNGEGDRVPGVVLDRYGSVAVARFDGDAIRAWADELVASLWPPLRQRGITSLAIRESTRGKVGVRTAAGDPMPDSVIVVERGMRMLVDLARGQKTGAFLDQRENRRRVRFMAAGARVLNLFSYAGGFSCAAALGGATYVTSVDVAHAAHGVAHETFRLNGIDPGAHTFVTSDVFSFLDHAHQRNERFDLVISDPPSFAPSEKSLPKALGAYRRLHEACARVVAKGGSLCAASCSSHVTSDAFLGTLDDEVLGGRSFRVIDSFGQPPDHPTIPGWPEGRYLKFVVLSEAQPRLTQG
jgi:23S rRNA (cytosine1962-C5)-methyltransferase